MTDLTSRKSNDSISPADIDGLQEILGSALCVPTISPPEDDINFWPLSRNVSEISAWLVHDTGLDILVKNPHLDEHKDLEFWPDIELCGDSLSRSMTSKEYDCLLVARHSSSMGAFFISLVLNSTDQQDTYERVGLLKHTDRIDSGLETVRVIIV
jgi:hypothetical protein